MFTVRLDSPVPLADQLVAGLRGVIARSEVRPDDRLPTVRQLAADLGINMNTVSRAYRVLESQGLVRTQRGRGTVVRSATERPGTAAPGQGPRRLGEALSDLRLAGLGRAAVESLLATQLDAIWPEDRS